MSKTKNFIFKGKQSFSSSKLDQIKHQFSNSNKINAKTYFPARRLRTVGMTKAILTKEIRLGINLK